MKMNNKLQTRLPLLGIAALAAALIAAAVLAGQHLLRAEAEVEDTAVANTNAEELLEKIQGILRDEQRDAQAKVEDALGMLDHTVREAPADPFSRFWTPFASPFPAGGSDLFEEMSRMRLNMDRLFNDVMGRLRKGEPQLAGTDIFTWSPQGEFEERSDAYVYRFDLPGVEQGKVSVTIEDGRLMLEGTRESRVEEKDEEKEVFRREIRHGQFRRIIPLPDDAEGGGAIDTRLEDGVLTVTIPKRHDAGDESAGN